MTFIDLFAGIGGFRLGLEKLGCKCVFTVEWDKFAQETHFNNFKAIPMGDITKISTFPAHDILCAGFPCQSFSISGKQAGFSDIRGTMFFEIIRVIKQTKPSYVFLENVRNLVKHDNGKTFAVIKESLESLGYYVSHKVYSGVDFNVPQDRKRVFIVASLKPGFEFPSVPCHKSRVYVKHILGKVNKYIALKPVYVKKPKLYTNKPIKLGIVGKGGQGERIYSIDGVGITLSAYGGGIGAKTGLYKVNNKIRKLTPRECARLSGYPNSFKIHPNNNQALKQFGNTVIPTIVSAIGEAILKHSLI